MFFPLLLPLPFALPIGVGKAEDLRDVTGGSNA